MTRPRMVCLACVGANLTFAALNGYKFATLGHWYSGAAVLISVGGALFCGWMAVLK